MQVGVPLGVLASASRGYRRLTVANRGSYLCPCTIRISVLSPQTSGLRYPMSLGTDVSDAGALRDLRNLVGTLPSVAFSVDESSHIENRV